MIVLARTLNWKSKNSLHLQQMKLAEREGFEPPVRFPVHLISSQAPSTGLGHLSVGFQLVTRSPITSQFLCYNVVTTPAHGFGKNLDHLFVWRVDIALVNRSPAMARSELAEILGNSCERPSGNRAMAKIVKVKIFDLRLLLGAIEGLPQSILADLLSVTREHDAGTMNAG